ncbi:MAG: TetR/AcrR family transcriptional regulator [Chloroflexi bacterium]|nr:TetR/AcrR family transcriptional regulator [Chloroflexota bacterium]
MPRPARKREDILAGAALVFRRLGYERSSMDAVAHAAGVSKATLYRYYPTKDALFLAVVEATPPARLAAPVAAADPGETLRQLGHAILTAVSDEAYLGLVRVVFGEGERFPHLGLAIRGRVFDRMFPALAGLMARWIAAGALRPLDARLAAQEFVGMILSYVFLRNIMPGGVDWGVTDEAVIAQVVTVFLYGAATARGETLPAAVPPGRE